MNKLPGIVLVCFQGDLFGDWVDAEFIRMVIQKTLRHPKHTFVFLTKNPERYMEFDFPMNCWLGETVTSGRHKGTIWNKPNLCFTSFEPLLGPVSGEVTISLQDWIIIGGKTPGLVHKPEWVESILRRAKSYNVPVYIKDNLRWPKEIKQFPKPRKA
jgi:protein gp37